MMSCLAELQVEKLLTDLMITGTRAERKPMNAASATRYDRNATNFLAAIRLVAVRLWIKPYESTP